MTALELGARGGAVWWLQDQLAQLGAGLDVDGAFGPQTDRAVRAFQDAQALAPDGAAGELTQAALIAALAARGVAGLERCAAGWGFLLDEEGHEDAPFRPPGSRSGITLSPGLDLGRQRDARTLQALYGGPLLGAAPIPAAGLALLEQAIGVRGPAADALLTAELRERVRVPRSAAAQLLPRLAAPIWWSATRLCPALVAPGCPRTFQTAALSLAFNAGPDAVAGLADSAQRGDWEGVADRIAAMHANQPAIAARRRREAELLLSGPAAP